MNTPMLEVVVKRSKWSGMKGNHATSRLLNATTQKMCCLGFVCEAIGVPRITMTGISYPYQISGVLPPQWRARLTEAGWRDSAPAAQLARVNDDPDMDMDEKEAEITRLGKEIGINFVFEG